MPGGFEEAPVIERILQHVEAWDPFPLLRASLDEGDWPDYCQIPLPYHPVPDIA